MNKECYAKRIKGEKCKGRIHQSYAIGVGIIYLCQHHICNQCGLLTSTKIPDIEKCKCRTFDCFGVKLKSKSCYGNVSNHFTWEYVYWKDRDIFCGKGDSYYACKYHFCAKCQRPKSRLLGGNSCEC